MFITNALKNEELIIYLTAKKPKILIWNDQGITFKLGLYVAPNDKELRLDWLEE